MRKNASGQIVGAQLINKSDGTPCTTGTTTVYVTGDGGTQAAGSVGSGACAHEGNGFWTLGDMSPSASIHGISNRGRGYAPLCRQFRSRSTSGAGGANADDGGVRQNRVCVLFSVLGAAFRNHVGRVVGWCSKKQMMRVHACAVVAPVKDPEIVDYRAVVNLKAHTMSRYRFPLPIVANLTVALEILRAPPRPAFAGIAFGDERPETILYRRNWRTLRRACSGAILAGCWSFQMTLRNLKRATAGLALTSYPALAGFDLARWGAKLAASILQSTLANCERFGALLTRSLDSCCSHDLLPFRVVLTMANSTPAARGQQ